MQDSRIAGLLLRVACVFLVGGFQHLQIPKADGYRLAGLNPQTASLKIRSPKP